MAESNLNLVPSEEPGVVLQAMYSDIGRERIRLRKKASDLKAPSTPEEYKSALQSVYREIDGTVMSFLQDLSHHAGQQAVAIDSAWDAIEAGADNASLPDTTQFVPEDAERFKRIAEYAKQTLELSLQQDITGEQRNVISMLLEDAKFCLISLTDNTLEDDDEEDPEEENEEEGAETDSTTET